MSISLSLDPADVERVARHFGAADRRVTGAGWQFRCPACAGWDFGPVLPLVTYVRTWLYGGRLPGGALGGAVCLDCGHSTSPAALDVPLD
ncbi:hypothetical protein AB0N77_21760 [Streptomyces misionensis]|uniref:hypothetical protein n=1 Tax=Streptomyces misionensis TaxID=67331 RepID=UPI0034452B42